MKLMLALDQFMNLLNSILYSEQEWKNIYIWNVLNLGFMNTREYKRTNRCIQPRNSSNKYNRCGKRKTLQIKTEFNIQLIRPGCTARADPFQDFVATSALNYSIGSIALHPGLLYKRQLYCRRFTCISTEIFCAKDHFKITFPTCVGGIGLEPFGGLSSIFLWAVSLLKFRKEKKRRPIGVIRHHGFSEAFKIVFLSNWNVLHVLPLVSPGQAFCEDKQTYCSRTASCHSDRSH